MSTQQQTRTFCVCGKQTGGEAFCSSKCTQRHRSNCFDTLLATLEFYVGICGNTAAMVPIDCAKEAYDRAKAAIALARKEGE